MEGGTELGPEPDVPPRGNIGGEPILPKPVVVGAISNEDVEKTIDAHRPAIVACYEAEAAGSPGLAGKVLVRFKIGKDGRVSDVGTQSTSLRRESVETCIEGVIAGIEFPALSVGDRALVTYPFVFPSP